MQFPIKDPLPGQITGSGVTRIKTDAGITSYAWRAVSPEQLEQEIEPALWGTDPAALEQHIAWGLLAWPSVEHALWDVIGKAAGLPVRRLLGGSVTGSPATSPAFGPARPTKLTSPGTAGGPHPGICGPRFPGR